MNEGGESWMDKNSVNIKLIFLILNCGKYNWLKQKRSYAFCIYNLWKSKIYDSNSTVINNKENSN